MKTLTCPQAGGPATCTATLSGNTAEEMVGNGMKHVAEAHPEMLADIKGMSKEATTAWMADFQKKFDAAPESK